MTGPESTEAIVALLRSLMGAVTTREIAGATGLFLDGAQFAVISDGRLLFRTDRQNRTDYEAFQIRSEDDFCPRGGIPADLPWRPVPGPVLDDEELLADWARRAWEAAKRARKAAGG